MGKDSDQKRRLAKLQRELEKEKLRGVVIVPGPNMRYFTGVESHMLERPFMLLVPSEGEAHLVAPTLEAVPYADSPLPMKIHPWTDSEGSSSAISKAAKDAGVKGRWGVEGRAPFLYLDKLMKKASPKLRNAEPVLQGLREVKDDSEVASLKKAASILSKSFEHFPSMIEAGMTEQELSRRATEEILANGATKVDEMLVQSGPRGASPHGLPTSKKVAKGEGIIIDVGATYQGYYADITRTYSVGPSADLEKVYRKVLEAEEAGIRASAAEVRVGDVDRAARGVLTRAGLGKYFIHRTGHGLGLEVHEAPYIVEGGREKLGPNMCYTVEPGVYIKGKLGVRIEDNVLIEGKKGVAITDTPKEFGWWV